MGKRKKKSLDPYFTSLYKCYPKIGKRSKYKIIKSLEETQEKKFGPGLGRVLRYDPQSMIYRNWTPQELNIFVL